MLHLSRIDHQLIEERLDYDIIERKTYAFFVVFPQFWFENSNSANNLLLHYDILNCQGRIKNWKMSHFGVHVLHNCNTYRMYQWIVFIATRMHVPKWPNSRPAPSPPPHVINAAHSCTNVKYALWQGTDVINGWGYFEAAKGLCTCAMHRVETAECRTVVQDSWRSTCVSAALDVGCQAATSVSISALV